jgi:hypothetical protein
MTRLTTLIWILVVVVAAFLLYMVKYQVQALRTQVVQTERELEAERESLHVVAAEWAYLNRPERLRSLAARYLSASGVTVEQIAEIEAIPFPSRVEAYVASEEGIRPVALKMQRGKPQ